MRRLSLIDVISHLGNFVSRLERYEAELMDEIFQCNKIRFILDKERELILLYILIYNFIIHHSGKVIQLKGLR